jgi:hypothetical protein
MPMMVKLLRLHNFIFYALATLFLVALSLNSAMAASLNLENLPAEFSSSNDFTESGKEVDFRNSADFEFPVVDLSISQTLGISTPRIGDIATFSITIPNLVLTQVSDIKIKNKLTKGIRQNINSPITKHYSMDAHSIDEIKNEVQGDITIRISESYKFLIPPLILH